MPSDVAVSNPEEKNLEDESDVGPIILSQGQHHEKKLPSHGIIFCHNGQEARFSSLAEVGVFLKLQDILDGALI